MNAALWRYLWRRHALGSALCALLPVLVGVVTGLVWPDYRAQVKLAGGFMKLMQTLLRSDLLAPDSPAFLFQLPFAHPASMLAMILAVAMPTMMLPAGARGRGSLDLLLATGLTRRELVVTTALFLVPFAVLLGLAPFLGTWIGGSLSGVTSDLPFTGYLRVSFAAFLLALFFGGLSQLLSVLASDGASAARWLAALVLFSLLADVTGAVWRRARALKYASPFGYYEPAQAISGIVDYSRNCTILAGGALLCFLAALALEERRRSA